MTRHVHVLRLSSWDSFEANQRNDCRLEELPQERDLPAKQNTTRSHHQLLCNPQGRESATLHWFYLLLQEWEERPQQRSDFLRSKSTVSWTFFASLIKSMSVSKGLLSDISLVRSKYKFIQDYLPVVCNCTGYVEYQLNIDKINLHTIHHALVSCPYLLSLSLMSGSSLLLNLQESSPCTEAGSLRPKLPHWIQNFGFTFSGWTRLTFLLQEHTKFGRQKGTKCSFF